MYSSFLKFLLIHPDVLDGHAVCLFLAKLKIFSEVYLVYFGSFGLWFLDRNFARVIRVISILKLSEKMNEI